ncbi:hypothetical protein [Marinobacter xestospongiae]|uniref:Aminomethyltransferase folate-binding domain-containing protein n=1 Tax=Marinobacter xestospongiae TaxID=994319 RepID=A0ABU3VZZ0_9GAMM|nr:hypothetical protein [Marinobacter xestospongiae]MDV2079853.1 hypothetical protein [Marinobacter xestospongiae]
MEELEGFSVYPVSETETYQRDADGQRVARLPGVVLEKAFRLKDGALLVVTTDDCPFEEGFHISLLRSDGSPLETACRAIPYCPGIIRNLFAISDDAVKMVLHDGEAIVIAVRPEGTRSPLKFIQQRFISNNGIFGRHYLEISAP